MPEKRTGEQLLKHQDLRRPHDSRTDAQSLDTRGTDRVESRGGGSGMRRPFDSLSISTHSLPESGKRKRGSTGKLDEGRESSCHRPLLVLWTRDAGLFIFRFIFNA